MPLFKVVYEGVFEGQSQNDAEVLASENRDHLQHTNTAEVKDDPSDFDPDDFEIYHNLFLGEDPLYDNLEVKHTRILLKDPEANFYIVQSGLKKSQRIGLLKINGEEKVEYVECAPEIMPLIVGTWIKLAGEIKK